MDCNQGEVDLHVLNNEEAAKREELCCLESRVLELKKEISLKTEGQQHLRVTKSKAETGMCTLKVNISGSHGGEGRK
jgi:hypothetical protein